MMKYVVSFVTLVVSAGIITGAVYFMNSEQEPVLIAETGSYETTDDWLQPQLPNASPEANQPPALNPLLMVDDHSISLGRSAEKGFGDEGNSVVVLGDPPLSGDRGSSFDFLLEEDNLLAAVYQQGGFDSIPQVYSHPVSNSSGGSSTGPLTSFVGTGELSSYRGGTGGAAGGGGGGSPGARSATDADTTVEDEVVDDDSEEGEGAPNGEVEPLKIVPGPVLPPPPITPALARGPFEDPEDEAKEDFIYKPKEDSVGDSGDVAGKVPAVAQDPVPVPEPSTWLLLGLGLLGLAKLRKRS